MTRDQAGGLLTLLQAAHPRTTLKDETLELWAGELRKLDWGIGESAVRSLIDGVKGWPTVAHLNECVQSAREQVLRVQRDEERRAAEEQADNVPRIALRDMPEVSDFLSRLRTGSSSAPPLDEADAGRCGDCGKVGDRFRLGQMRVCANCGDKRLGARFRLVAGANGEAA